MQKSGKSCEAEVFHPEMVRELTDAELETIIGGTGDDKGSASPTQSPAAMDPLSQLPVLGGLMSSLGLSSLTSMAGSLGNLGSVTNGGLLGSL